MNTLLKLEEAAQWALSMWLFSLLPYAWWVYPAWLLAPDIGMVGYLISPAVGAKTYNLFHHKGLAVVVGLAGLYFSIPGLQLAGIILFGHSAMDRLMGYGLKYPDDFKHTHLGWLHQPKGK